MWNQFNAMRSTFVWITLFRKKNSGKEKSSKKIYLFININFVWCWPMEDSVQLCVVQMYIQCVFCWVFVRVLYLHRKHSPTVCQPIESESVFAQKWCCCYNSRLFVRGNWLVMGAIKLLIVSDFIFTNNETKISLLLVRSLDPNKKIKTYSIVDPFSCLSHNHVQPERSTNLDKQHCFGYFYRIT